MKIKYLNKHLAYVTAPMMLAVALLLTSGAHTSAWGSGFVVARFGGEHGHPTTNNLSAIYQMGLSPLGA